MITAGQYADLGNGIRLHYASCGARDRPLMLFLHGFPEYWGAWEELLPSFADTHHAVAPDLRGFNLSSQPAEVSAYRMREIVGDLDRFVAHLGADRAIVVAHDWGGAVAWQWAIARPERIKQARHPELAAPDSVRARPRVQSRAAARQRLHELAARAGGRRRAGEGRFHPARRVLSRHAAGGRALVHGRATRRGTTRCGRADSRAASTTTGRRRCIRRRPTIRARRHCELKPADFRVKVPTLVIWGEADIALPVTLLDGLDELVDDLTVYRLPRATHWVAHEEPDEVARLIREFIVR